MIDVLDCIGYIFAPRTYSEYKIKQIYKKPQEDLTFEDQFFYYASRGLIHSDNFIKKIKRAEFDEEIDCERLNEIAEGGMKRHMDSKILTNFFLNRAKLYGWKSKRYEGYPTNYPILS